MKISVMKRLPLSGVAAKIATVCGAGYLTKMPGTVGSAVACVLYVFLPIRWWVVLAVALAGVWASDVHARATGVVDPSEVVIDEVVGMWLSLYALPPSSFIPAFFLFRVVDIVKPVPVCTAEKLPGGWGIMADDVLGGIITNLIFQAIYWILWDQGWLRSLFV
ncbi:MAG: phosphatidylglycerophosphatase A [Synergistaceae bacterium]|jgi:phosphatidylglycerophosphatase A|nr:phosphatidylglycerophosphatase A [Synergistaceae bacterium]